ncbi:MAG: hypothetical protein Kow0069_35830 [Promethearchaeota archaeon]
MALNFAPDAPTFFASVLLELWFLVAVVFGAWLNAKRGVVGSIGEGVTRYGFVLPGEGTRGAQKTARAVADASLGVAVAAGLYYLGGWLVRFTRDVTIRLFGEEHYQAAAAGAVNTSPPSLSHAQVVFAVVLMFAVVGVWEEAFFRGLMIADLSEVAPRWAAWLASVAAFGLYHVPPFVVPWQTTATFLPFYAAMGAALVALHAWRGPSLLAVVVAHGTYNSILFVLAYW